MTKNQSSPSKICIADKETKPWESLSKSFGVEVAGKRGTKQLIIVFGDAPDENKEQAKLETCESDDGDYIFEPSENPQGESSPPFDQKRKDRLVDGLGRSGGTRTHGLQYPKLARYQLRYTSI